ncbi:hypothetical protein ACFZBM_27110 [Streptomyces lavendulae]|uniref:Uncharacterized protein n=1 Tax=Streptomyces lavendulae subsp. lavendulae TaxID=58340 RepID=A0A2K8PAC9_STRLA|nr:hypothetical protein [Streptomyces lavendulae]ATZ23689.1 hypothetical protein SLAV_09100 [Streptomyces lavendulae subsp. lavendulae]QUQ53521.1 hypothetical protein SLLC_07130 [Streptomyces lavendulae subsp. lavendulae]
MSAAHATGTPVTARPAVTVRPRCTAAVAAVSAVRTADNGWD